MKNILKMSIDTYIKKIVFVIIIVTLLSWITPFVVYSIMRYGFVRLIIVTLCSFISSVLVIYSVGITNDERQILNHFFYKKIQIIINK